MEINKNVILHEYMYQQEIQSLNERRLARGEDVITTSNARELHTKLLQTTGSNTLSVVPSVFCKSLNFVLSDYNQGQPIYADFDETSKKRPTKYTQMLQEVSTLTGWSGNISAAAMIPLSPYDENYSRRITFLNNGGALLYVTNSDLDKPDTEVVLSRLTDNGYMKSVGELEQPGDLAGLGMLAPYISKRDYNSVKTWVADAGKVRDADGTFHYNKNRYMSAQALERSAGILRKMQEEGINYSVECDDNVGQIRAKITGTKISVRLTDSPENEMYIGKVYDDGIGAYYTTNAKYKTENDTWRNREYVPSAQETMDLLHFMRGDKLMMPDKKIPVGQPATYDYNAGTRGKSAQIQNLAYYTADGYMAAVKPYANRSDRFVLIKTENNRSGISVNFDKIQAENFLSESICSARENFSELLAVDYLIAQSVAHANETDYIPVYSGDAAIASIQRSYWDVLTNSNMELLKPGISSDELSDTIQAVRDLQLSEDAEKSFTEGMIYAGTPEEKVKNHALDVVSITIGNFESDEDGKRFDAANVSKYMKSEFGIFRNNDNMVAAMKTIKINPSELRGDDFYNQSLRDKMIEFDDKTAKPMALYSNSFVQHMYDSVKESLSGCGCEFDEKNILMDSNGIVRYQAKRVVNMAASKSIREDVSGEIGQIFIPDDLGMVQTRFAGSDNYLFVPGYEASVVPATGDMVGKSLEERTRLKGYEQLMSENIKYHIRSDMMSNRDSKQILGTTTNLNDTYRRVYDTRHGLDYIKESYDNGMTPEILHDIIRTEACRIRYSNDFKENSTVNADFQSKDNVVDGANDNFMDFYNLSGRRNMSILTEDGDGYFDPIATATATNQGITRYLVEGAKVDIDGHIIPSHKDDRTPILKNEVCKYMHFNPFDRQVMTFNNLMTASSVPRNVKTAQMTFGGWNFDDGYVVSTDFAERYTQRDSDGKLRSIIIGDKISDMNGNKGVINLKVDRTMTLDLIQKEMHLNLDEDFESKDNQGNNMTGTVEYRGQTIPVELNSCSDDSYERQAAMGIQKAYGYENCEEVIKWFAANPDLDVVGAPFPAPSRFNGGSARELMKQPEDLYHPDGTVHEGCIGSATYIVTHMSVDSKSHIYDDDAMAEGRGRKASAQLAWALDAKDCPAILNEFYGPNNSSVSNLREYMLTCGMDIDAVGTMQLNYVPHDGESRNVFQIPELEYRTVKNKAGQDIKKLDIKSMKSKFGTILSQQGGILELPFPIKYPTGAETPVMNDTHTDIIYTEQEFERKGYTRKDGTYVKPTVVHKQQQHEINHEMYGLPVISSYLRSGNELVDGSTVVHDYTNQYLRIYESAISYMDAANSLAMATDDKSRQKLESIMVSSQKSAQTNYDRITDDMKTRIFSGKHNYFRDHIMSSKLPDSATMVWTADPRLKLDEIAMSQKSMDGLKLKEGEYTLMWRDPILSDGGIRFLKVVRNDLLTGIAINPTIDKSFEGDFDGDSGGLKKPVHVISAQEALSKFSMEANLLNYEEQNEDGTYEFYVQDSLDLKSAKFARPELVERHSELTRRVNEFEADFTKGVISQADVDVLRKNALSDLSDYTLDALGHEFGTDMISFKDMPSHMHSVEQMVVHKAKGSYDKIADYAKYLGVTYDRVPSNIDENEPIAMNSIIDHGDTLATRTDVLDVAYAVSIKSFGTGIAGMYSQRAISALRNDLPAQALGLTHPVTQAILQSKHDPIKAAHQYGMLMKPCRELWRGRKLEQALSEDGSMIWKVSRDKSGQPIQADKATFINQFKMMYTDKRMGLGVSINPDYVKDIAEFCVDKETGKMRDIESIAKTDASVLDKLAYGGTFDTVVKACQEHTNLFEGKNTAGFMPSTIRRNLKVLNDPDSAKSVKPIVKSDVKESVLPIKYSGKAISVKVEARKPVKQTVDLSQELGQLDADKSVRPSPDFMKTGLVSAVESIDTELQ